MVIAVVLTFAMAIGANAAMYGLVTRLMLAAPVGVSSPESLVRTRLTTSFPEFREIAERRDVVTSAAAVRDLSLIIGAGETATAVQGVAASGNYFAVLGARPVLGRFFAMDDDILPSGSPVAVLSYVFWKKHHAGDPRVVGSAISIDGQPFTIIGVAAPDFTGDAIARVDVFVPISAAMRVRDPQWWSNADIHVVEVIARLAEGLTSDAAAAALGRELDSLIPSEVRHSNEARIARWLLGVSVVVLLIATANVATLLLLRALRKRRDIAVRMALGAGRGRMARRLAAESLLLALAGASAGLFIAGPLADVVRATLMPALAASDQMVTPRLLRASLLIATCAGLAAGFAPLVLISQRRLAADLSGTGTLGGAARTRMQMLLVGGQVALCMVLLIGAGLFVRSLERVRTQELGYSPSRLLHVTLDFRESIGGARADAAYFAAAERVRQLDGVTGASVVQAMPFGNFHVPPISIPGRDEPPTSDGQPPFLYAATPDYLRLMDVRAVQGRLFNESDASGMLVVLVNETFARHVWPGENALGKCIRTGHDPALEEPSMLASAALPCRTVIGVVRDSRVRSLRPTGREASLMQFYVPFDQAPKFPFASDPSEVNALIVGTRGDPLALALVVQRLIQGSAATPVYARVQPFQHLLDPQLRPWKLGATVFVAFGGLALAIAALGLYGVISYLTSQRTREIGLRLALGGTGTAVGRAVVMAAIRMVTIGIIAGVVGALAAAPFAQELLFDTAPYDVTIIGTAMLTLLLVTASAAVLPAWRAARVSPMVALRVD